MLRNRLTPTFLALALFVLARAAVAGTVCGPTMITESTSQAITAGNSKACGNTGVQTFENHYWRAFDMNSYVDGPFQVCDVQIGVESAVSPGGAGQSVTLNLYTSAGPFPASARTLIGTAGASIADADSLSIVDIPITATVPRSATLVVEIVSPSIASNIFLIGSNASGESAPSYISAPACAVPNATPETFAAFGFPNVAVVMNIIGTEVVATPTAPLRVDVHAGIGTDSNLNGVFDPGETVQVEPSWTNPGPGTFNVLGLASNFVGPFGPTYTIANSTADYGAVAAGDSSNCFDATIDCFELTVTGTRPIQHWDTSFDETTQLNTTSLANAAAPGTTTWVLHIGGSFDDVALDNQFYRAIETIFHNGITTGCLGGPSFCPDQDNLRNEMAIFVLRAKLGKDYIPPDPTGIFDDVPADGFEKWVEDLYNRGITAGCAGGPPPAPISFCPERQILRKEMAIFILKGLLGSDYVPSDPVGIFDDVPVDAFEKWIEDLYNHGITSGCSGGPPPAPISFCPEDPVSRAQMASFLTRAFTLVLYGPAL